MPGYHLGLVSYILVLCQRFKGEDFVCKGFFNAFYMFKKFKKQKSIFLRQVFKNFFNSSHRKENFLFTRNLHFILRTL